MEIIIPTSWEDITVNQYQALSQINKDDYATDFKYTCAVLQVICNLDSVVDLPLNFISEVSPLIAFLSEDIPSERHTHVNIEGDTYSWIGSFNELTVGEALSIEQIIDLEELTYNLSYDVIAAVLLRKEGEDFDSSKFQEYRAKFGELPITEVIGMILFFLSGGSLCIRDMKTYSIKASIKPSTQKKKSRLKRLLQRVKKLLPFTSGLRWLTS